MNFKYKLFKAHQIKLRNRFSETKPCIRLPDKSNSYPLNDFVWIWYKYGFHGKQTQKLENTLK